jgi:hypothetical protein
VAQTFRKIVASAALACLSVGAQAAVLTFEDVPLSTGRHFFLADYHGFTFGTNSLATNAWFYTDEVTSFYTPKSPTHFIATDFQLYNGTLFEATQSITSVTDFVFDGAWFTGQDQIRYQLYNNGVLVHTSTDSQLLNDTTPIFVNSGYTGLVDEVVILGTQGFYALDDFTYNTGTGVPEPTSLALVLLAGAVGVGATRRKAADVGRASAA